jgi:hypothetical protein
MGATAPDAARRLMSMNASPRVMPVNRPGAPVAGIARSYRSPRSFASRLATGQSARCAPGR